MVIYISGGITNVPNYEQKFAECERKFEEQNIEVINPSRIKLHKTATHDDYMRVCLEELKLANTIYLLKGWRKSPGACIEYGFALAKNMTIIEQGSEIDILEIK